MYNSIEISNRLKLLRKTNKKTQLQVSKDTKLSIDTISKIESGKRCPSIAIVDILRNYYNTTADYILFGTREVKTVDKYNLKEINLLVERILRNLRGLI